MPGSKEKYGSYEKELFQNPNSYNKYAANNHVERVNRIEKRDYIDPIVQRTKTLVPAKTTLEYNKNNDQNIAGFNSGELLERNKSVMDVARKVGTDREVVQEENVEQGEHQEL